jgi:hypothetical protein
MKHPHLASEDDYTKMLNGVGSGCYHLYDDTKDLPFPFLNYRISQDPLTSVVAASGTTAHDYAFEYKSYRADGGYSTEDFVVPHNSDIIVVRFLGFDDTHGDPHYNADDQVFFPVKSGNILRMSRQDAQDHYIPIVGDSTVWDVATAYHLPLEDYGPVQNYTANGASFPIQLIPGTKDDR